MSGIKKIFSKKYITKYEEKIKYLGPNNKISLENFLLTRLFLSIVLLIICLIIPKYGLILAIIVAISFYYLYTSILIDNKIRIRNDKLYDEAILFFNMLKLSYDKTKDIKTSLEIVSNKLGNSISITFRKVLKNNRYNNDLKEVFSKVIETIPNKDVKNALVDLKECNNYYDCLERITENLKDKNVVILKSKYQFKPIILVFVSLVFISIICILLFNIYDIINYLNSLFV
ncbi:MAG: hypothetical protein IJ572_02325 [Bacilli bacterium]|nr:hypothetical protein [Bacilli bacterium]